MVKKTTKNAVTKNGKARKAEVTAENFVRAWQTSETIEEVCQKTGMTRISCRQRAYQLRKKEVPLKKVVGGIGGRKVDYDALKKLAESLE
jgi:response regulator of citrate/malate metabolism